MVRTDYVRLRPCKRRINLNLNPLKGMAFIVRHDKIFNMSTCQRTSISGIVHLIIKLMYLIKQ